MTGCPACSAAQQITTVAKPWGDNLEVTPTTTTAAATTTTTTATATATATATTTTTTTILNRAPTRAYESLDGEVGQTGDHDDDHQVGIFHLCPEYSVTRLPAKESSGTSGTYQQRGLVYRCSAPVWNSQVKSSSKGAKKRTSSPILRCPIVRFWPKSSRLCQRRSQGFDARCANLRATQRTVVIHNGRRLTQVGLVHSHAPSHAQSRLTTAINNAITGCSHKADSRQLVTCC